MGKRNVNKLEPMSPLRYPGGKALLATYIGGVIEENFLSGCSFYEPFAGGAAVSLELMKFGFIANATLVERDPLVYAFWWSVLNAPDDLCQLIKKCEITIDTWETFQNARAVENPFSCEYTLLELGMAGLFFNRTNFSGIIGAGPIGGRSQSSDYKIDCRFNKQRIVDQIMEIKKFSNRIKINFGDAVSFLDENSKIIAGDFSFVYVDPPYYLQGKKLYRYFYGDDDHCSLSKFIRAQEYPWLLSYDDHPRVRELYSDNEIQPIYLDYKVKSSRVAQELVISNLVIPPPVYVGSITQQVGAEVSSGQDQTIMMAT